MAPDFLGGNLFMLTDVATCWCYLLCPTGANDSSLLPDESWPGCFELVGSRAGSLAGGRWRESGGRRRRRLLPVPQDLQRFDSRGPDGAVAAATTGFLANRCGVRPPERLIRSGNGIQIGDEFLVETGYRCHTFGKEQATCLFMIRFKSWVCNIWLDCWPAKIFPLSIWIEESFLPFERLSYQDHNCLTPGQQSPCDILKGCMKGAQNESVSWNLKWSEEEISHWKFPFSSSLVFSLQIQHVLTSLPTDGDIRIAKLLRQCNTPGDMSHGHGRTSSDRGIQAWWPRRPRQGTKSRPFTSLEPNPPGKVWYGSTLANAFSVTLEVATQWASVMTSCFHATPDESLTET